jgi:hypothetical protein
MTNFPLGDRPKRSSQTHRFRRLAAAASTFVTFLGVVAASTAWAEPDDDATVDEHPGLILTEENNCFETADRRPVLLTHAQSYVPDRYMVTPVPGPPGGPSQVANVGFIDYVCGSLSVNGHKPRPTIVSMGTVLVRRDGISTDYVLWVATDNPLHFARMQQLGVDAHFIPNSSYSETINANGQRQISVHYVEDRPGGLNNTRTITVLVAPSGPPAQGTGVFYHLGRKGEVSFTFDNLVQTGRANVCFQLEPESLPTVYGITSFCFPNPRNFFVGSWTGRIELLSSPTSG